MVHRHKETEGTIHSSHANRELTKNSNKRQREKSAIESGLKYLGQPVSTHRFFDTAIQKERFIFIKSIFFGIIFFSIIIIANLSIYWGAISGVGQYTQSLKGLVIDNDKGAVGSAVKQAIYPLTGLSHQLDWRISESPDSLSLEKAIQSVLNEEYWVVVIISSGASAKLNAAIASVDSAYNASSAILIYCSEARNEVGYARYVLPQVQSVMKMSQKIFIDHHLRSLSSLPISTLLRLLKDAPHILYQPIDFEVRNLRPFDVPV
ncbi:hypothetical protein O181_027358 [Austropuccinia psidii MF-1]|uniref:DUF3533 domain-containing protein n=1 Tax=Austropuccinia psidii MF-1 TaxID=1389203 RepID=A0A9Q3H0V6_9BASI|nr:hypothetical protein [Austropuccinia psidii MF-1]